MQKIGFQLIRIYREVTGREYPRKKPHAAELLADGLNNRAVSMLDLGKEGEAERLFINALEKDATHPEATFNLSLLKWREGEIDDLEVIRRLDNCRQNPAYDQKHVAKLLAAVHAENMSPALTRRARNPKMHLIRCAL